MENRRKSLRIPFVMTVHLSRKGGQDSREALVRDICTHGMGIYTNEVYQKGDILLIDISLQDDRKREIRESIGGEVAWVESLQEGSKYMLGIRFERMEKEKSTLYEYIRRLEQKMNYYQNS